MTLTILVPLDGSPLAERALPFAARLASGQRGEIVLMHVRSPRVPDVLPEEHLEAAVARLRQEGISATSLTLLAQSDQVADMLGTAALEMAADLIVMSTHGRGGLRRSIFGSVADKLVRSAEVPVLLVPPNCPVSWQDRQQTRVLVPLDGSPLAEAALESAARLAGHLKAEILLVRALSAMLHTRYREDKLVLSYADFTEVEDAWRYLSTVADGLKARGYPVSFWVLVGTPAATIVDAAHGEGADLIVMTTHGRGGLGRLLLGSVADSILRRSSVPILLVRSGQAAYLAQTDSEPAATGIAPTNGPLNGFGAATPSVRETTRT